MRLSQEIKDKFGSKIRQYLETDSQDIKKRFFIYCEGECTEPNYFNGLNRAYKNIEIRVHGEGYNTKSLVNRAKEISKELEKSYGNKFDYYWVVFDKDSFSKDDFDNAVSMCQATKIFSAAWSNECFELWFLLHFEYLNSGLTRDKYSKKLKIHLGGKYEKNDPKIYNKLSAHTQTAINNAKKLVSVNGDKTPCQSNPGTTVYELVEQIISSN